MNRQFKYASTCCNLMMRLLHENKNEVEYEWVGNVNGLEWECDFNVAKINGNENVLECH